MNKEQREAIKKWINEDADSHRKSGHTVQKIAQREGKWVQYTFVCECGWREGYDDTLS